MTLSVIGAGFGRTGTLSLKLALEMLGLGPCYHMVEVLKKHRHAERWSAAAERAPDWDKLLFGYGSAVDWPSTCFWRELADHYPSAKIVLTVRSSESWLRSMQATVFETLRAPRPSDADPAAAAHADMLKKLILDRTFGGDIDDGPRAVAAYERHNEEVRRALPAERLLVYQVGEGWEPLCRFLGVPVPAAAFPQVNSTDEFRAKLPR
jgi:hypothetical protein